MEHERCYLYSPPGSEERPSKRQRTSNSKPQADLSARLNIYREAWATQEKRIQVEYTTHTSVHCTHPWQATLEEADSATQGRIVDFVAASGRTHDESQPSIPTGLVVAGPSIASHGPYFERLGRKIRDETHSSYVVLTSGESPNLKTFLKNLIRKITSRIEEDEEEEGLGRIAGSSRKGPKLLNFDLGHVQEWLAKSRVPSIVVAIQDSEAFDTGLLIELVDLF